MTTTNAALRDWVAEVARLTQPDRIQWCDGSDAERDQLIADDARATATCCASTPRRTPTATCTARIRRTSRASST